MGILIHVALYYHFGFPGVFGSEPSLTDAASYMDAFFKIKDQLLDRYKGESYEG